MNKYSAKLPKLIITYKSNKHTTLKCNGVHTSSFVCSNVCFKI